MTKQVLMFVNTDLGRYEVLHENGVSLGQLFAKEDGFYDWWPTQWNGGYIPSYILREIADKLDELNQEWGKNIDEYFESVTTEYIKVGQYE